MVRILLIIEPLPSGDLSETPKRRFLPSPGSE
jgi:hypothetical protein